MEVLRVGSSTLIIDSSRQVSLYWIKQPIITEDHIP